MTVQATTPLKRADVPHEQTWNRESVFPTDEAFQQEVNDINVMLTKFENFAGKLGESSDVIVDWLNIYTRTRRRVYRLFAFTRMATAVDTYDVLAKSQRGQLMSLMAKLNAACAFAEPELLSLGDKLRDLANQNPDLKIYAHYFDNLLRQKRHTQSPDVERLLGMVQDAFAGTFQTYHEIVSSDMRFPPAKDSTDNSHVVSQAIVPPTGIQSHDRILRRTAWESFCDEHRAMQNTLASNLITSVKQHVFLARARGYSSVLESRLAPANLPVDVFHTLIETFESNLPVWHRYWEAKRNALKVDQLHPYDTWAPIVDDEPHITYQQAIDWICAGLIPLGDEYVAILRRGCLEERWVDYAQNEGRLQGAFSCPVHDSHPFVFNTFDGSLMAMSVLAHELGHAMHRYNMHQHQPEIYNGFFAAGASSSVDETASNLHQALTRAYLMKEKADDRTFQLALINEAMFNFHRYFFVMPTLARFEFEVYSRAEQDKPLNADILNAIMGEKFADGYGNTMTDDPNRTETTWGQYLHLYMPYYSFQYSVGISAAHALAGDILAGDEIAINNYLAFLRAGWSKYAPDLFKLAGVDMTTSDPIVKTFAVMENLVERLENLVAE